VWNALGLASKIVALIVLFVSATVGGLVLHMGMRAPRIFVVAQVNQTLADSFKGRVILHRLGSASLMRLGGIDADIHDPQGERVAALRGASVDVGTFALLRSLVSGDRLRIPIQALDVDSAEIVLEQNEAGQLGIARAFEPKDPPNVDEPSRPTEVAIDRIRIDHIWVHGHLEGVPWLDADLDEIEGSFQSRDDAVVVAVDHLSVYGRGIEGKNPRGGLEGRVMLPSAPDAEIEAAGHFDGFIGAVPLVLDGELSHGERIDAVADVRETPASAIDALEPSILSVGAPVRAHVEAHGVLSNLVVSLAAHVGSGQMKLDGTAHVETGVDATYGGDGRLEIEALDLSQLDPSLPVSTFTATLDARAKSTPGGHVAGTFEWTQFKSDVASQTVPPARIEGAFTEKSVRGDAHIDEPGAPTTVHFDLRPKDERGTKPDFLSFDVATEVARLDRVSRAGRVGTGQLAIHASGTADLGAQTVDARAVVDGTGVEVSGVCVSALHAMAHAHGPFERPALSADLRAAPLTFRGRRFEDVAVRVHGGLEALDVAAHLTGSENAPTIAATAHVNLVDGVGVRGAHVTVNHHDVDATIDVASVTVRGGEVDVRGVAVDGLGGAIRASATVSPGGRITALADASRIDVSKIAHLAGVSEPVRGLVNVHVDVATNPSGAQGELWLSATGFSGFGLEGDASIRGEIHKRKVDATIEAQRLRIADLEGIGGTVTVSVDGDSNATSIVGTVTDPTGTLATLDVSGTPPVRKILAAPERTLALVEQAPITAHLHVPERALGKFPKMSDRLPIEGSASADARLEGTLIEPTLHVDAQVAGLQPRDGSPCARSIDVTAAVDYDGRKATAAFGVHAADAQVVDASLVLRAPVAALLRGDSKLDWSAQLEAKLHGLPLDAIAPFIHQPIVGTVDGEVKLEGLHEDARLDARLQLSKVVIGDAALPHGEVQAKIGGGKFDSAVRLEQSDGNAEVLARGTMAWGKEVTPSLDFKDAIDLTLNAKNFRADFLRPLTDGVVTELDGRIDSHAKLHVEPGGKTGQADGAIAVRDGTFNAAQLGQRFHNIQGKIVMQPWGTVRLQGFSAEGRTGKVAAEASAVIDGLNLKTAKATIDIEEGASLPVVVEGVPMGRIHGHVDVDAKMSSSAKRLDVTVNVPVLGMDLPATSQHSPQSLDPNEDVRIGVGQGDSFRLVALEEQPPEKVTEPDGASTKVVVTVKLKKARIRRDTTLDVTLRGKIVLELAEKTEVSGEIHLVSGKLDVEGKMFEIDRGIVSFVGDDPSNPEIQATAFWDAPDGIRVYADYTGVAAKGNLALRSEPSLSQEEILSLVLYGSTDGGFGASAQPGQEDDAAVKGAGVAGGPITQSMNRAIKGVTSADISTRIDSSDANNPKPEVAIQLTQSVSARLGYKLGNAAPGDAPDRATLTVDWHFLRNWTLSAEVGDQGSTSLDALWRHRY